MLDGSSFQTWVLGFLGSVVVCVAAFKLVSHYVKSEMGEFITAIAGAAVVAGFTLAPETAKTILLFIWHKLTGTA